MPGMLATMRRCFEKIADPRSRRNSIKHTLTDTLMSALAMFSLKYPSLLQFDSRARGDDTVRHNLRTLYEVIDAPCDTQMRSILDPIEPGELRPTFRALHSALQRGNALQDFAWDDDTYLLSIDGTGLFSSTQVSCPHCCEKKTRNGPEYYHQVLVAVIVHPDRRTVLPLDFEPITRADGATKNDCERNAAKRLLESVAKQYPKRRFVVVEDALAANGPHLQSLQQYGMDFIIGAKPGGNPTLFKAVQERLQQGLCTEWEEVDERTGGTRGYRFTHQVPLNHEHPDLTVNFLEYWEVDAKGKERIWSWITNLAITRINAEGLMRAGRARWKIENAAHLGVAGRVLHPIEGAQVVTDAIVFMEPGIKLQQRGILQREHRQCRTQGVGKLMLDALPAASRVRDLFEAPAHRGQHARHGEILA